MLRKKLMCCGGGVYPRQGLIGRYHQFTRRSTHFLGDRMVNFFEKPIVVLFGDGMLNSPRLLTNLGGYAHERLRRVPRAL